MTWRAFPLVLALGLVATGCPMGPFSGGYLRGEVHAEPVRDWTFVEETETCQLETNPDEPHSVNTWCVGWRGDLYVPTSMILGPVDPSGREWVRNVQSEPEIRIRIDGRVYELEATQVTDNAEYARVIAALEAKYDVDPADREPEREIWLFRLHAR
jgi:hypothetical protein